MASDPAVVTVLVSSISGAFKKYPNRGDGTTWDDQTLSLETSKHLANALLNDLDEAGFEIVKKK